MSNDFKQKKKEILLKILEGLYSTWPLAGGIYILVNEADPEDDMIDSLLVTMKGAMKDMKDGDAKKKMSDSIDMLEKMTVMKAAERIDKLVELEELLKKLDELY